MRRQRGPSAQSHGREQRALVRDERTGSHDSQQNPTAESPGRGSRVSLAVGLPEGRPVRLEAERRARDKRLARIGY